MNQRCAIPFRLSLMHPKHWMTWLGLALFSLVSLFPTRIRHFLGKKVGAIIYEKNNKRRNTSLKNIQIAFPDLSLSEQQDLAKRQLQWYGSALLDYSLHFFSSKARLSKMLEIEGKEYIDEALNNNKSIMILLAHSNSLEFAPTALGLHYEIFGSYKTSRNPVIDWMIARSRCRHVTLLVSREEGLRKLIKTIQPGKLMIFLPDEDLGLQNAVFAPFFGKQKSTLATTARMAKMSKAVALPTYTYFDNESGKYKVKVSAPLKAYPSTDAVADATNLNSALEALIKEQPAQYMWGLKWFYTRPEGEKSVY